MSGPSETFNGQFIHIDNIVSSDIADCLLHVKHGGFFTSKNCPKQKRQSDDDYFFMIVSNGKGIVQYEQNIMEVSKGQCAFLDCSTPHYYLPDPKDPWEVTWINFGGPSAKYYHQLFLDKKNCIFTPQNFDIIHIILTNIVKNNLNSNENTPLMNSKLISDLMTTVILNNTTSYEDYSGSSKHKLLAIKSYLDENFTSNINLDELSERFFISKFYLTREFKKSFGTTVIQYILNKRIEYAKELLIYTNKSVEEISDNCGFHDQSYFSRQFKKAENTTCLAYRKQNV